MTNDKGILIKNIYYMLAYAFQVLKRKNYEHIASEDFEHIEDLFAEILSQGISFQLKQGLYHEYTPKCESLSILRGKLNRNETIKHIINRQQIASCEFDELSENNIYNQILKTTAKILLGEKTVAKVRKTKLKKILLFFSGIDEISPKNIKWSMLTFQRSNQTYRMLLNICFFVLEGLLQTTDDGKYYMAEFSEERLARLYEKFVLEYFKQEHPELKVKASKINWDINYKTDSKGLELLPEMQSDILLEYNDKTLIIDTKYYANTLQMKYDKHSLHSDNLYQIFSYVKNHDNLHSGSVAGMLLYAKTQEETTPDIKVNIGGNDIYARTLDLNNEFKIITAQLDDVASILFT